ncbi:uncharacterized protein KGF55_001167 [Candida pseudojiufengensis]|uniref:uncharacterized protein n=1 Tax=Candida pseudojiufengensis TaxID=497109 RepID=UPI0022258CEA|nr:uncharacterized protein KGF55_001167 [Candida pseudojiufengensis]KAI5965804.1 hypothetical protein KGF55_001167 [Candida pseudojiufengensis]
MNPNPRKSSLSSKCEPNDLVKLSACCNDILSKLDECKPNDLACECCALQSINQECYHLCPGNPNTNFLSVLLSDCKVMSEINACSIPFKKEDPEPPKKFFRGNNNENDSLGDGIENYYEDLIKDDDPRLNDEKIDASLQSKIYNVEDLTERPFKSKKIKLVIPDDELIDNNEGIQNKDLEVIDHSKEEVKKLNTNVKLINSTYTNVTNSTSLIVAAKKSNSQKDYNGWSLIFFVLSSYLLLSM